MIQNKISRSMLVLFSMILLSRSTIAATTSDEGDAAKFQNKVVNMKAKSEFAVLLSVPAGKEVTATTDGEKNTDVHLFVFDPAKKEVGKDTSPGPKCQVKFTPAESGKFKLLVKNLGSANTVTLAVKVAD